MTLKEVSSRVLYHIFSKMTQQYFTVEQGLNVRVYSLQQEFHKADLKLQLALAVNNTIAIRECKTAIDVLQQQQLSLKEELRKQQCAA